jgi:hypothetical protein
MRDYQILKDDAPWRKLAYSYLTAGHNSDVECLLGKLYVLQTYLKRKRDTLVEYLTGLKCSEYCGYFIKI